MSLENGNYKLARGQRVRHTAGRLTDTQQVDIFPLALSLWSASDFQTMILYTFVYERPSRATPKFLKTLKILRFASTPVRSFSRLSPASVCPGQTWPEFRQSALPGVWKNLRNISHRKTEIDWPQDSLTCNGNASFWR